MVLRVPWQKPPSKRRREIIVPKSASRQDARPIRAETRAKLRAPGDRDQLFRLIATSRSD
jgi:hypothetical protein